MPELPSKIAGHLSVRNVLARGKAGKPGVIDANWLRELCLEAGADDVAAVSLDHPDLAGERPYVLDALPGTRSLISLVVRMNRDNVRTPARSVANQEFHRSGEIINEAARDITRALQDAGHRVINPSATFPMEMDRFPGRIWVVAHKTVAVAAGLGAMGIHRNVIHPRFGNFVLLATILVDAEVSESGQALDYNPATVADSADGADFRSRVTESENASMWQSLSFKANYKAAYCMAVCPTARTCSGPFSRTARSSWTPCCARCRTRKRRSTSLQGLPRNSTSSADFRESP